MKKIEKFYNTVIIMQFSLSFVSTLLRIYWNKVSRYVCIEVPIFIVFLQQQRHRVAIGLTLSINHLYEMSVIRPSPINPSNSSLSGTVPIAIYDIARCVTPDARLSSNVIYASLVLPSNIIIITSSNSSFNSCQSLKILSLRFILKLKK